MSADDRLDARPVAVYEITDRDALRFLSKLAPPDENGCRLWTSRAQPDGYG